MKAIVTVTGKDTVGIIAGVCTELANLEVNILDINQTVMDGFFVMNMLVDLSTSTKSYDLVRDSLDAKGVQMGLTIRIQREDIFNAMHRI
ncbi:MAG: ACT domain-containing protein [Oscillospiraceae bacterium]|nr:ACT domain-containing protein [Oscillospiraceae bacterium]